MLKKNKLIYKRKFIFSLHYFINGFLQSYQKGNLSKERKRRSPSSRYRERYGFKRLKFYVWYASKVLDYKLAKSIFFLKTLSLSLLVWSSSLLFMELKFSCSISAQLCTYKVRISDTDTRTYTLTHAPQMTPTATSAWTWTEKNVDLKTLKKLLHESFQVEPASILCYMSDSKILSSFLTI